MLTVDYQEITIFVFTIGILGYLMGKGIELLINEYRKEKSRYGRIQNRNPHV